MHCTWSPRVNQWNSGSLCFTARSLFDSFKVICKKQVVYVTSCRWQYFVVLKIKAESPLTGENGLIWKRRLTGHEQGVWKTPLTIHEDKKGVFAFWNIEHSLWRRTTAQSGCLSVVDDAGCANHDGRYGKRRGTLQISDILVVNDIDSNNNDRLLRKRRTNWQLKTLWESVAMAAPSMIYISVEDDEIQSLTTCQGPIVFKSPVILNICNASFHFVSSWDEFIKGNHATAWLVSYDKISRLAALLFFLLRSPTIMSIISKKFPTFADFKFFDISKLERVVSRSARHLRLHLRSHEFDVQRQATFWLAVIKRFSWSLVSLATMGTYRYRTVDCTCYLPLGFCGDHNLFKNHKWIAHAAPWRLSWNANLIVCDSVLLKRLFVSKPHLIFGLQ